MNIVEPADLCKLREDVQRLRVALAELRLERDTLYLEAQSASTPGLKRLDAMLRYSELTGEMRELRKKLDQTRNEAVSSF